MPVYTAMHHQANCQRFIMTKPVDLSNRPHRRRNPLTDEWVLVSPHRNKRPWQGQTEKDQTPSQQTYDSTCYLCPGNERMGGQKNPNYENTFVFGNDFPALTLQNSAAPFEQDEPDPLFTAQMEQGECRVVAYSPNHCKTLAELGTTQLTAVIQQWIQQSDELGKQYPWVQIFENKGEVMGCSMPHPHGQIWAQTQPPTLLAKESLHQQNYYATHSTAMLLDYALRERADGSRLLVDSGDWIAVVPYWAAWPFEVLLLPTFAVAQLTQLTASQQANLAIALKNLLARYDNLFQCSFPYSMGWHGAPYDQTPNTHWQLHAHFYPPLLRSSSVRKFMVGYEMLAEPQRDLTSEQAADLLRDVSSVHYLEQP